MYWPPVVPRSILLDRLMSAFGETSNDLAPCLAGSPDPLPRAIYRIRNSSVRAGKPGLADRFAPQWVRLVISVREEKHFHISRPHAPA